jgi:hypothetical protein
MTQNRINKSHTVLQVVTAATAEVVTCSTAMPADNSIPQNGEGDEVLTLAITPTYANTTLEIIFVGIITKDANAGRSSVALFQDSTASALAARSISSPASRGSNLLLKHYMTSGTTSSTTFKIRIGPAANTVYVNGNTSGTRLMGGVSCTRLTIIEYL